MSRQRNGFRKQVTEAKQGAFGAEEKGKGKGNVPGGGREGTGRIGLQTGSVLLSLSLLPTFLNRILKLN